jgi:general stress protein 26
MAETLFSTQDSDLLWDSVRDIRTAMLTTREADGTLRGRPMATQQVRTSDDGVSGVLWFFSRFDSEKAKEIENDSQVQVSYVDKGLARFVSISGIASLTQEKAKIDELWHDDLDQWFKDGKNDPSVALTRVAVASAEYWTGPESKVDKFIDHVKEKLSKPFEPHGRAKAEVL